MTVLSARHGEDGPKERHTFEQAERQFRPEHGLHRLINVLNVDCTRTDLVRERQVGERSTAHLSTQSILERDLRCAFAGVAKPMLVDEKVHRAGICRHVVFVAPFLTKLETTPVSEFSVISRVG